MGIKMTHILSMWLAYVQCPDASYAIIVAVPVIEKRSLVQKKMTNETFIFSKILLSLVHSYICIQIPSRYKLEEVKTISASICLFRLLETGKTKSVLWN